ncbi:MAG: amidohydrolase [Desulfobacter sp.]|nr:amidohydrolase [Desulfobacter sp.]WDP87745.1 MAG: amidohydrolase [Desulfobacter sp.]
MDDDILIFNGMMLTMEEGLPVVKNGAVRIQGNTIAACGDLQSVDDASASLRIDARGGIIMPGLVNGHTHAPMSMFRGLADDLPLDEWLNEHIFPAEARQVNPESAAKWTAHSCQEMLLAGITTCCDGYFFETHVAKAMAKIGIRAVAGQGVIDFPAPGIKDPKKNIAHAKAYVEEVKGRYPCILPSIFCHSPYTCSKATLQAAKSAAQEADVLFQIHAAETQNESIPQGHGHSVISYLDNIGILDEKTLLVHSVWVDEADLKIIQKRKSKVIHCPESNMKLASGIAPVPKMLDAGIVVGLGTDGCASNNDHDLFSEMDTAAKLHKVACMDPCVMDARTCLAMATIKGADAIGLGDRTGSIRPGKLADIIIVDRSKPHMVPMHDPYSTLVYAAKSSDVSWVIVDGIVRVKKGRLI